MDRDNEKNIPFIYNTSESMFFFFNEIYTDASDIGYFRRSKIISLQKRTSKIQKESLQPSRNAQGDFILFKLNIFKEAQEQEQKISHKPPNILYLSLEEKYLEDILMKGIRAKKGFKIRLSINITKALSFIKDKKKLHLLKIDTLQMYKDGIVFIRSKEDEWFIEEIESQYIAFLV